MDVELRLEGAEANEANTLALADWIRQERIPGLAAQVKSLAPRQGEMGGGLETAIAITATSTDALRKVAKVVAAFLNLAPKRRIQVSFVAKGVKVQIDAVNLSEQDAILDRIVTVLEAAVKA